MKRTILVVVVVALAAVPLDAGDRPNAVPAMSDPPVHALPNPAARHCLALGGIARLADEGIWGGPPIGLCRLRDDSVIVDWTLFDAAHGIENLAAEAFLAGDWQPMSGPIETWAEEACTDAGGQVVAYVEHLRPSCGAKLCRFPDGSAVEAWTMFAGPDHYPELARRVHPVDLSDALFQPCPWPRTCMAPCQDDPPLQVLCKVANGDVEPTSFACCCCGSGTNAYVPLPGR
jgi:putative hemolysin